jgi:hypothetical protein
LCDVIELGNVFLVVSISEELVVFFVGIELEGMLVVSEQTVMSVGQVSHTSSLQKSK